MTWTELRALAALLLVNACAPDAAANARCAGRTPAVVTAALYAGSTEPLLVALTPEQRRAFVTIEPAAGYARSLCSGVLIDARWVLTAKHCDEPAALVVISDSDAGVLATDVAQRVLHPELDLMLLELSAPADRRWVDPVLPSASELDACSVGRAVELAGSGETETGDVGVLHFLVAQIAELSTTAIIVDGRGERGACVGDSGGPLLVQDVTGAPRVAGILSTGSPSCVDRDEYTRLDRARPWLASVLEPY